jgi:hypothetical protein
VGKNRSKNRRKNEKRKEQKRKRKREDYSAPDQKEGPCQQSEEMEKPCLASSLTMGEDVPDIERWTLAEFKRQWASGKL